MLWVVVQLVVMMRSVSLDRNSQTTVNLTCPRQGTKFDLLFQFAHGFDRVEVDGCRVVVWVAGLALPLV